MQRHRARDEGAGWLLGAKGATDVLRWEQGTETNVE